MQNLSERTRRLIEGQVELPCGNCRILDLDALICAKEAMNRDHDRITVLQLREIKRRLAEGK